MAFKERQKLIEAVEEQRGKRTLVNFFNFDRTSDPAVPGLMTQFHAEAKEALFRVLKESPFKKGVDLCVYTRGGDTNSVWPIVSLVREFDRDFNVLAPYRCHSSGTLLALGAKQIVLGPLSELSPIDATTGNQFNPVDPANSGKRLGISVEDVRAYRAFIVKLMEGDGTGTQRESGQASDAIPLALLPLVQKLTDQVHPLALGNVERVLLLTEQLADNLLKHHKFDDREPKKIVGALTSKFYSHTHMINRHEAKEILGKRVAFAPKPLTDAMDKLLKEYEDSFRLRRTFYLQSYLGDKPEAEVRFVGGALESRHWSYLYITKAVIRQRTKLQPNVQVQIPSGQSMPLIPGLPREIDVEIREQGWVRNVEPLGVTV